MEKIEQYKIVTIEDEEGKDHDYVVANLVLYNECTYLYLIEVDKEENLIEQNQMIGKLVVSEGNETIEKIVEADELKEISKIFFDLFKEANETIEE